MAFLAFELVIFDFLASDILQAMSWLDHGLVTIANMLGPQVNQDLNP